MTVPEWFRWALEQQPHRFELDVEGVPIAYRAWGEPGDPVAVLVHGGAAHSGWWDHVAPHLAVGHRVIAPDLSGHGDSGHRDAYTLEQWAREVLTVAQSESAEQPVVFGHSMGGFVALTAAREHGVLVSVLGPRVGRLVTHLDVDDAGIDRAIDVLTTVLRAA